MRRPAPTPILAVFLALLAAAPAGCGTTTVLTTEPTARVLADGQMLGRGQGQLTRRGLPGSTSLVVKTEDGRQGQLQLRRQFTVLTLVLGLFTYGVCLIACWEYPDTVLVPLASGPANPAFAPPGAAPAGVDPWLVPPPGWQPRAN